MQSKLFSKIQMYNNLYILHRDNFYWTCIGDESEYSKNYRKNAPERYCLGTGWEEIGSIPTNSEAEAKELQLKINTVFKPFITVNSIIYITMYQDLFLSCVEQIMKSDNNRMLEILNTITGHFDYDKKYGNVYFVACKNDKYKIGCSTDFVRRWKDLMNEEQNQAIYMIDVFKSNDMYLDEARLQCKCYKYKDNSNKDIKYIQEIGNSELYKKCVEVETIWREYDQRREI